MFSQFRVLMTAIGAAAVVASCSSGSAPPRFAKPKAEPWRASTERACLSSGLVRESRFVVPRSSLGGPGGGVASCGAFRPFVVKAADNGRVRLQPSATLRCPMIPALNQWMRDVVAPSADRWRGAYVVKVRVAASYGCRPINHKRGGKLSEHGRANAIDISAFELADGRVVNLKRGWRGTRDERGFLRDVHRGACRIFSTVLGPNADRFHHDHFHLDLARHGRTGTYRVCR